jgi:hypothetical protein
MPRLGRAVIWISLALLLLFVIAWAAVALPGGPSTTQVVDAILERHPGIPEYGKPRADEGFTKLGEGEGNRPTRGTRYDFWHRYALYGSESDFGPILNRISASLTEEGWSVSPLHDRDAALMLRADKGDDCLTYWDWDKYRLHGLYGPDRNDARYSSIHYSSLLLLIFESRCSAS